MTTGPLDTFAAQPGMVLLAHQLRAAGLDAVLIVRGRSPDSAVQVLGLSVSSADTLRSLVQATLDALDRNPVRRIDPTASTG